MSVSEGTPREDAGQPSASPEPPPSGTATAPRPPEDDFDFLDPPHGPHELGSLGGYRVVRVLGQGGMGVVFEARDPMLHRRLAIKVPRGAGAEGAFRQRFLQEAQLAASLPHDHIAAIYQVGEQRGVPFLAMEFLQGESLQSRLEREHTLPVAEALRIARETAEGLAVAHAAGLVHRDIKPGNGWLDSQGRVKILDFGLARPIHALDPLTEPGQIVGSPGYMSPEQVYGLPVGARSDLFSLGCVLYRMLCGKLPFGGDNTMQMLRAAAQGEAVPAALIAPELPDPVLVLVQELLQKNPELRPVSAQAVVERIRAIERDLTGPAPALPPAPAAPGAPPRRKHSWGMLAGALVILLAALAGLAALAQRLASPNGSAAESEGVTPGAGRPPLKVGVLFSTTGAMAASETPVLEATLFALDEINRAGGVLGRRVETVVADGHSEELVFAEKAAKLIRGDGVVTVFGCWTSGSRKRVAEVCAKHDNLLVYPLNYEGLEDSPYVVYAGGGPNQQLIPALGWAVGMLNRRHFFLVGSDGVYSHASNEIIKDRLKELRAECVGEAYLPIHSASGPLAAEIVKRIKASKADAILSTVDGLHSNVAFFRALAAAQVEPPGVPCLSFAFGEDEARNLSKRSVVGHYAAFNYCQSLDTPANRAFLKRFRARYPGRVVTDPMEAAYCAVHLWRQAVTQAKQDRPAAIRRAFRGQKFDGPEGLVEIDAKTGHALRVARVGRVDDNREFHIEFNSPRPMPPEPFPPSRTRAQWEAYLQGLYRGWGDHWEAPAAP
jgi:urea transport system substrate-binding protein